MNKTCTHCHNSFPDTNDFFNFKGRLDKRLRAICKNCELTYRTNNKENKRLVDKKYREQNKESLAKSKSEYHKKNKERDNARWYKWYEANAEKFKNYIKEYTAKNKEHKKEYDKKYRKENFDKIYARQKIWISENIDHARMYKRAATNKRRSLFLNAEGFYTTKDIEEIYNSQDGKCYYCKKDVGHKFHIDHYVPLSKGGTNNPDNLVISCPSCNLRKSNKMPEDFINY